ncbi:MAG: DUF512 domain-containing protein [Ruminococcaceae bacterium]|nr:DUF512 domain-containing protein [Oscillospiraceae bacterium]
MSVRIKGIIKSSPAYGRGIKAGDILLSLNGKPVNDFLDYQFYAKEKSVTAEFQSGDKVKFTRIRKSEEEDLGLEFESFLMDEQHHCKNKCIFCFIDQLPSGMRKTLYFKDDDSRLSFLFGNYITLTNLTERDVERIIEMHISPVNISVHTMNKELRIKMMKNKRAGECLDIIGRLAENGIEINTQLVLCPGINDGEELRYSLSELGRLYPGVRSIAAVPVGVTKYREGLFEMPEYTAEAAGEVIDIISDFGDAFREKHGTRLAYAADEFYLKAGRKIPDGDYYESYSQIENGVGMWTSLKEEFLSALELSDYCGGEKRLSIATGVAAAPLMQELSQALMQKYPRITVSVYPIVNDFFGHSITVAGLITGGDLINQLKDKKLHGRLLIPSVMLRSEGDIFLDDISLEQTEDALGVSITPVSCDGQEFLNTILE